MRMGAVLLGPVLALCLVVQGVRAAPAPSTLNLRVGDLPRGWMMATLQQANPAAARLYQLQYRVMSPILAHSAGEVRYFKRGHDTPADSIVSAAFVYGTPAQAHMAFVRERAKWAQLTRAGYVTSVAEGVGDERLAIAVAQHSALSLVEFRRGSCLAEVFIDVSGKPAMAGQAARLAHLIDTRIQHAH